LHRVPKGADVDPCCQKLKILHEGTPLIKRVSTSAVLADA
jgi:hypothetical protein